jgi:hypothetical protein
LRRGGTAGVAVRWLAHHGLPVRDGLRVADGLRAASGPHRSACERGARWELTRVLIKKNERCPVRICEMWPIFFTRDH